jgi:hypothetical protein
MELYDAYKKNDYADPGGMPDVARRCGNCATCRQYLLHEKVRDNFVGSRGAQQEKVIYGPYKVTCGTTSHHFNVKGASGQVPVIVQQLKYGSWASITAATYDPSGRFGAGTLRLVIDNRQSNTSVSYTGTFVVPM